MFYKIKSESEAENDILEDGQRICPVARLQGFKRKGRTVISSGPASQIRAASFGDKVAHVQGAFLS